MAIKQIRTATGDAKIDYEWLENLPKARVSSLDTTEFAVDRIVETVGNPIYLSAAEAAAKSGYSLTEAGWYVFARISCPSGVTVGAGCTITGAAGYVSPVTGADHVDIAVKFETSASSKKITVNWGTSSEVFVFKSTDLAIRNLDYRVTYYLYDIADYTTWTWAVTSDTTFQSTKRYYTHYSPATVEVGAEVPANTYYELSSYAYALTADTTFQAGKTYYTYDATKYVQATVTAGQSVVANTYYNHTAVTFSGFPRNVSYYCGVEIDCPITINMPTVAEVNYGAWFEIQLAFLANKSITYVPGAGTTMSTTAVTATAAGVNVLNCQYFCTKKVWGIANNVWKL